MNCVYDCNCVKSCVILYKYIYTYILLNIMNGKRYYNFCTISALVRNESALNKNSVTVLFYFIFFYPYLQYNLAISI